MQRKYKIKLVNYEQGLGVKDGILTKYSEKMRDELVKLGHDVKIDSKPDDYSEIHHHINYLPYQKGNGVNTLMVTHFLDTEKEKINLLREHLKTADVGICFSRETVDRFNQDKLTYILPAHDGLVRRPLVIAVLTKVYPDGRKREQMLLELSKKIDKTKFAFRIMGDGWRPIVEEMIKDGWTNLEYFESFDYRIHKAILDSSDYLLYTGLEDEGAMSVLDATQAGLKTIAPLRGFHIDIGIDLPFVTQKELESIFEKLAYNKVEDWTWKKYAEEHLKIWEKSLK